MILAISVRQPYAWAIIHGGKNVENRSQGAVRHMCFHNVDRIAIHASKGMTREEYEDASGFMARLGVTCPPAADLLRGGIIGTVGIVGIVKEHESPWFFGPRGIVVKDPIPCEFVAGAGALGLFNWPHGLAAHGEPDPPAKWMTGEARRARVMKRAAIAPMLAPSLFRENN
jgi:hypothetical protein